MASQAERFKPSFLNCGSSSDIIILLFCSKLRGQMVTAGKSILPGNFVVTTVDIGYLKYFCIPSTTDDK